jgi:chromosome segregation ATPase
MDLNTLQQAQLIADLQLSVDDEAKLISELRLKVEEQLAIIEQLNDLINIPDVDLAKILAELSASKAQVNDLLDKLGKSEAEKAALQAQIDELKGRSSGDPIEWLKTQWDKPEGKIIIIGIAVLLFYVLFEAGPGKGFFKRR